MAEAVEVPRSLATMIPSRVVGIVSATATLATFLLVVAEFSDTGVGASTVVDGALLVLATSIFAMCAWVLSVRRPRAAIAVGVVALSCVASAFALVSGLPDAVQAGLANLAPVGAAAASIVGMGWRPPLRRPSALVVAPLLGAALILVTGFDPLREPRCIAGCLDAPALFAALLSARAALTCAATLVVVAALLFTLLALRGGRALAPVTVLLGGSVYLWIESLSLASRAILWDTVASAPRLALSDALGPTVFAICLLLALASESRTRAAAAELTRNLARQTDEEALHSLQFVVPGEHRWVDWLGRPVQLRPGETVMDKGEPVARFASESSGSANAQRELGASLILALRNAQLAAAFRARVLELQDSRRRIVEAGDAASRSIERDLHDGAQQRLVSAILYLAVARGQHAPSDELGEAEIAIRTALQQLRFIAHGLVPELLRTAGVWAAIREAAADIAVPAEIDVPVERASDDRAGIALYSAVAAIMRAAAEEESTVRLRIIGKNGAGALSVIADLEGARLRESALTDAADRIGAVGGTLSIDVGPRRTRIEVRVPCVSSSPTT